jgi:hypothetical protein
MRRERKGNRRSRGIEIITPSIKSRGGRSSSAAVIPKPNIIYTASDNKSEVFINAIEDQRISSLPDIPSNGRLDRGFFEGVAVVHQEIVETRRPKSRRTLVEEIPHFTGLGAEDKQVISVFIEGAGRARRGGGQTMEEAALVGRKAPPPC